MIKYANHVSLVKQKTVGKKRMPNVMGMGARDAVYLIESRGATCRVKGRGKVVAQSLPLGHYIKKGDVCALTLE